MLTIICGEDTVSSRKYYSGLKDEYIKKGTEIREIIPIQINEILKWQGENLSLFGTKQVFFTELLDATIIKKRGKKSTKPVVVLTQEMIAESILKRKDIDLVVWEEKGQRELKLKTIAQIKEFKPSESVFKLLDSCKPGSLSAFVRVLNTILESQDVMFVFIMLYRHMRTLLLAYEDVFAPTVQSWQKGRLTSQAKAWQQDKLAQFYEALYRIEVTNKSGTNPHGLKKSLEILACFYL